MVPDSGGAHVGAKYTVGFTVDGQSPKLEVNDKTSVGDVVQALEDQFKAFTPRPHVHFTPSEDRTHIILAEKAAREGSRPRITGLAVHATTAVPNKRPTFVARKIVDKEVEINVSPGEVWQLRAYPLVERKWFDANDCRRFEPTYATGRRQYSHGGKDFYLFEPHQLLLEGARDAFVPGGMGDNRGNVELAVVAYGDDGPSEENESLLKKAGLRRHKIHVDGFSSEKTHGAALVVVERGVVAGTPPTDLVAALRKSIVPVLVCEPTLVQPLGIAPAVPVQSAGPMFVADVTSTPKSARTPRLGTLTAGLSGAISVQYLTGGQPAPGVRWSDLFAHADAEDDMEQDETARIISVSPPLGD